MGTIYQYSIKGYREYTRNYATEILQILTEITKDEDMNFFIALNEAVCNAARYSVSKIEDAEIEIEIRVDECSVKATVKSSTKSFDAKKFRDDLRKMADQIGNLDWRKLMHDSTNGKGIWLMLAGSRFIYMDEYGQKISLYLSLPFRKDQINYRIKNLVPKFFIDSNGLLS